MPLAAKRYLACLAVIGLLMAVYSAAMTPLLHSPEQLNLSTQESVASSQADGWWRDLFPPDAWQNQNPMVIQTQQGTLLFKEISKTTNSDTLRLSPLTLIIPVSNTGHAPVVGDLNASLRVYRESQLAVVLAPEGAEIQFREAPDWASGTAPPVKEGKLLGHIQIFGVNPKLRQAANEVQQKTPIEWQIDTTMVRISGRHVWTNNDVTLKFGSNVAAGKDISIFLKQDLMGKRAGGDGPWGLLDYMEIRTLKYVNVSLPPGGLWKGLKLGPPELAAAQENLPARLLLTCKGIFQFDFDESEAKLSDHVSIDHRFENAQVSDTFVCHELSAKLSEPIPGRAPTASTVMVGPMKLDHVYAVAIDSAAIDSVGPITTINRVKLNAPNIAASLDAKRIEVILDDEAKGQCFFINSLNGRASQGARQSFTPILISYMGTTIQANNLKYISDPNQVHPGWLEANGPGEIRTSNNSAVGNAGARWQTKLSMCPAENQPLHVITLEGSALIEAYGNSPDTGGVASPAASSPFLNSERIEITLKTPAKPAPGAPDNSTASAMRVKRIDAIGIPKPNAQGEPASTEVVMGNDSQNVRVKELHLNFVYPETPTAAPDNNSLELTDAAGRPMRQWIGQPASTSTGSPNLSSSTNSQLQGQAIPQASTPQAIAAQPPLGLPLNIGPSPARSSNTNGSSMPQPPGAAQANPAEPATPVLVLGKALYSDIVIGSPKPWIEKLVITGPVVISPKGPPQNEAPTWRIDGAQLQLNSDVDDHYRMQIAGGPARITFGDGWLEGPIVQLDQRSGHVWIENEGVLCVPTNLMQSRISQPTNNKGNPQLLTQSSVQWLQPLKCYWRGNMLFNGLTANIVGKISFKEGIARTGPDRLLFVEGACEALEVRMSEPINMGNPGKTNATAQSLTLRDNVNIVTDQTDLRKNRVSRECLLVPELSYELATNTLRSRGIGNIYSQHQSGGSGLGMMAGQNKSTARNQLAANTLQGMHLKFRDSMELLLTEKRLSFMGKVEVGLSPIQSFDQQVDINSMRVLQLDQSLLNGDLLRIYDASDVTHRPTATMADGSWEFAAQGNVFFENRTDNGEVVGKASELTFIQAKDLLIIRGDTRIPAEIRFRPENREKGALGILSLNQGSFNTKTLGQEGDLQITSMQWVPHSAPLPTNWKTDNLTPPTAGTAANPNPLPGATSITPTTPRPRDGLQNWLKPK